MAKRGWGTARVQCQHAMYQVEEMRGLRTLVSGEHDLGILEELCAKHVGQSMVLLVEGEDGAVGCAYENELGMIASGGRTWGRVRVSATSVHFFSPSPRRKSSNLSKESVSSRQGPPSAHPISSHLYHAKAEAEEPRKNRDVPIGGVHFGVFVAVRDWSTRGISKLLTVVVVVHCEICVKTSGLSELHTYKKVGAKRLFTFHRG